MNRINMATLIASAFAGLAVAQPAAAEAGSSAAAEVPAAADRQQTKAERRPTKYCVMVEPTTGSRIAVRSCRTKAEWQSAGVELDAAR